MGKLVSGRKYNKTKILDSDDFEESVDYPVHMNPLGGVVCGSHTLFKNTIPQHDTLYRLYLDIFDSASIKLQSVLNVLLESSPMDFLEIRVNSVGGMLSYGLPIINLMRNTFYRRTRTIIDFEACSMGAMVFLAGHERYIYPDSMLMLHEISYGYSGKASSMTDYVKIKHEYNKKLCDSLVGQFLTDAEKQDIYAGKDLFYNAEQMCQKNMVHGVIVGGDNVLSPKDYLLFLAHPEVRVENEDGISFDFEKLTKKVTDTKAAKNPVRKVKSKKNVSPRESGE